MAKMKLAILLLCAVCAVNSARAQESVNYTVVDNQTTLPMVRLAVAPLHMDMCFSGINNEFNGFGRTFAGYGYSIQVNPIKPLSINYSRYGSQFADLTRWSITSSVASPANITVDEFKKSRVTDFNGEFNFSNKEKNSAYDVVLSSQTSGRFTTSQHIYANGKRRSVKSLRLGLTSYRKSYFTENVVANDSTRFVGNNVTFDDGSTAKGNGTDWWYVQRTTAMYAGISTASFGNIEVNAQGYGMRKSGSYFKLYADVMFAISNTVKLDFEGNAYKLPETDLDDQALWNNTGIGWRVGAVYQIGASRSGLAMQMEVGSRPEYGGFMHFNVAVPLNVYHRDLGL